MTQPSEVRRVERASLDELGKLHVDAVYEHMDWLVERRPTPLDLYRRWEGQQWSIQELDFAQDVVHWRAMTGFLEGVRVELQWAFTLFFLGEQAVTDTLAPLVHAAPDEPCRIFLATQLADEARHAVFFSRFFEEVVGLPGGLSEALPALKQRVVGAYRAIFDEDLLEATEAVRLDPGDYAKWVEAITVYHLMVEGMLALTGQKFLLRALRELGVLPAFYRGFTAVARDESRHISFGVGVLAAARRRDPSLAQRIEAVVFRLLEPACRVIAAPDRKYAVKPEETPSNLHVNPYEVRAFSIKSLTKRLRVAGLSRQVCEEITRRADSYYEQAWAEYEDRHGEAHPHRYFQAGAAAST